MHLVSTIDLLCGVYDIQPSRHLKREIHKRLIALDILRVDASDYATDKQLEFLDECEAYIRKYAKIFKLKST